MLKKLPLISVTKSLIFSRNFNYLLIFLIFTISHFLSAQTSNLWVTINPNSGSSNQVNADTVINNGFTIENNSSNNISSTQFTNGNDLVYSITSKGIDIDKDGRSDEVSFDLIIKGYVGATYNYNANANSSSVTNYGRQVGVTVINNSWGVFDDYDVDAGESLIYEIENVTINGANSGIEFNTNFTSANLIEPNGGRDHTMIFGFGDSLESLEIDSDKSIALSSQDSFSVTGAGSFFEGDREWSITSLTFKIEINGPNTVSDLTDYSWIEKGATFYHDYPAQTNQKSTLPNFSWDKIPRWVAARNADAFTDEQIQDIANNFQLILLEKANQQGFEYIEDGIENAATRIKAVNPKLTTLFYYNTKINYYSYRANIEYEQNAAEWSSYEDGSIFLFKDLYYWYNQDVKEMREWWIDTCVEMAKLDVIDGVFVDKVVNPDENGDMFSANGVTPVNNYTRMLRDLYNQLPSDKLLIGNTLRNERAGGARDLMKIMDGSYLERWGVPSRDGQSDTEAIAVSIQLMREALQKGKMINIQTNPGYSTDEDKPTDPAELLEYTKKYVYFPLAVYLIIAEENAYFSYTTGVNAIATSSDIWDTSFIEEFDYFLGAPLGDPTIDGYLYKRSFENLDVWVNIETKETDFKWKGKTSSTSNDDINLALNGKARQSSTDFSGEASRAIDGYVNGKFSEGSVTHTNSEVNAYWQVTLDADYTIGDINIFGRTDDCCIEKLSNFTVLVLDSNGNFNFVKSFNEYPDPSITINAEGALGSVIRIRSNSGQALSLAEVQVFERENLASNGKARQSSTDFSGEASRAIDGNINGKFSEGSVTHTNSEVNAYWQVTLDADYTIGDINIFGRTDDCCVERLSNFTVLVLDSNGNFNFVKNFNEYPDPSITINAEGALGSVIRIRSNSGQALSLAEVQVFERENLASNGKARQSSTDFSGEASKAIDGNINGKFSEGSVTHTNSEVNAYWQVTLDADYTIGDINIFGRTDDCCVERLSNFTVLVLDSNGNFNFVKNFNEYPDPSITINAGGALGNVVRIRSNSGQALSLAEVQVFESTTASKNIVSIVENTLELYPNPAQNSFQIDSTDILSVEIYNISGELIKSFDESTALYLVDGLTPGMYLVKTITTDGRLHVDKLVKL